MIRKDSMIGRYFSITICSKEEHWRLLTLSSSHADKEKLLLSYLGWQCKGNLSGYLKQNGGKRGDEAFYEIVRKNVYKRCYSVIRSQSTI